MRCEEPFVLLLALDRCGSRNCSRVHFGPVRTHGARPDFITERLLESPFRRLEIVVHLQTHPELWSHIEISCQSKRSVRSNSPTLADNLRYARHRYTQCERQAVC